MEKTSFGKKREICMPGDEVGSGELRAGSGTYRRGDKIFASVVGIRSVRSNFINIIPLAGKYLPRVGDQVIGYVTDVGPTYWLMDINSPYPAPLHSNDTPWKIDFGDTSKYLSVDNAVMLSVSNVDEIKHIQVSMREHGHRKLNAGSIIEISPSKVPRIIGRGGSMISLLKTGTECRIFVGQNGRIWVDGEPEAMELAISAINTIDQDSQSFGLTERIKEMLGVKDDGPGPDGQNKSEGHNRDGDTDEGESNGYGEKNVSAENETAEQNENQEDDQRM